MVPGAPLVLALAGLALATGVRCQTPATRRSNERIAVVVHGLTDREADAVLAVADAAWQHAERLFGAAPPERRLSELHVYADAEDYRTADRARTGGRFQRNLACALFDGSAHVAVQPPVSRAFLDEVGLPLQTLRLIAHETTHLARYATCPSHRAHPRWVGDVCAQEVSLRVLQQRGVARVWDEEPAFAAHATRVFRLIEDGRLATFDQILARATQRDGEHGTFHDLYATHFVLGRALGEDGRARVAAAAHRIPAGTAAADVDRWLRTEVAPRAEDRAAVDAAVRELAGAPDVAWVELQRSTGYRDADGLVLETVAFPDQNVLCWSTQWVGDGAWDLGGRARFLPAARGQLDLLLGRREQGFVKVAFVRGARVVVFAYDAGADAWRELARADREGLGVEGEFAFAAHWDGERVHVAVDGTEVLAVEVGVPMTGPWGVGALAGSAGQWRGLEFRRR